MWGKLGITEPFSWIAGKLFVILRILKIRIKKYSLKFPDNYFFYFLTVINSIPVSYIDMLIVVLTFTFKFQDASNNLESNPNIILTHF